MNKILFIFLATTLLSGCRSEIGHDVVSKGDSADSDYPAIGFRKFSCSPNCNREDANTEFKYSADLNRIVKLISQSKSEIVFNFFGYLTSDSILDEIVRAANRGVRIKIFVDGFNKSESDPKVAAKVLLLNTSKRFKKLNPVERLAMIRANEINDDISYFTKLQMILNQDGNQVTFIKECVDFIYHVKFILIDNRFLIASTGNLSFAGLGFSYEIFSYNDSQKNPEIVEPFRCFVKTVDSEGRNTLKCSTNNVFFTMPTSELMYGVLHDKLANAKKRIWIAGNQFGTSLLPDVFSIVKDRNVDFRILTGSNVCAENERLAEYRRLGIDVKCLPVNACLYQQFHNKYIIIDDDFYYGTMNLDFDGFFRSWDFLIQQNVFLSQAEAHFSSLWDQSATQADTYCDKNSECLAKHCIEPTKASDAEQDEQCIIKFKESR